MAIPTTIHPLRPVLAALATLLSFGAAPVESCVSDVEPILPSVPALASAEAVNQASLVARLKAGEDAAFDKLLHTYGPRLLAVARRMMGNDDDAADALQDAMLSAFKSIHAFDGRSMLSTWLHRIVVNACLMKMRTRRRHPETSIEKLLPVFESGGHHVHPVHPWDASASPATSEDTRSLVRRLIDELPETYREVLVLRDVQELNTEQTAEALQISSSAVKTRLHRARLALRELLDPYLRAGTLDGVQRTEPPEKEDAS